MSEGLEKLQTIGAQKINDKTHIPVEHVQALLYESFDGLTKVQFLGFISILERDYALDLSDLRSQGLHFIEEKTNSSQSKGVFMPQPKKSKFTSFYFLLALMVFIAIVYISMNSSDKAVETLEVDSSLILDVQKNIVAATLHEENLTNAETNLSSHEANLTLLDANETVQVEQAAKAPESTAVAESLKSNSLKIVTKKKLWLGYIDRTNDTHFNKTFVGELELDASREWLLFFGHRFVELIVDGKTFHVDSQARARFLYKDGVLKAIDAEEFKRLNKGKEW